MSDHLLVLEPWPCLSRFNSDKHHLRTVSYKQISTTIRIQFSGLCSYETLKWTLWYSNQIWLSILLGFFKKLFKIYQKGKIWVLSYSEEYPILVYETKFHFNKFCKFYPLDKLQVVVINSLISFASIFPPFYIFIVKLKIFLFHINFPDLVFWNIKNPVSLQKERMSSLF